MAVLHHLSLLPVEESVQVGAEVSSFVVVKKLAKKK